MSDSKSNSDYDVEKDQIRQTPSEQSHVDAVGTSALPRVSIKVPRTQTTRSHIPIGFRTLSETEGIIPALETAHAIWGAMEIAKTMKPDQTIVICVSGRGDKDVQSVANELPRLGPQIGWDLRF